MKIGLDRQYLSDGSICKRIFCVGRHFFAWLKVPIEYSSAERPHLQGTYLRYYDPRLNKVDIRLLILVIISTIGSTPLVTLHQFNNKLYYNAYTTSKPIIRLDTTKHTILNTWIC